MSSAVRYFKISRLFIVLAALNSMLALTASAQVFGGSSASDETFENTFSAQAQESNAKTQATKSIQFKPVAQSQDNFQVDDEDDDHTQRVIQIFMDNFRILPTFSKTTHCSMTFHVLSTLPMPITNISFRLKWQNMETPLSFDNVPAKDTASKNYTLLGQGCYDMDMPPTIIVNRCRVKGITQEDCTSLIQWVK